jgi:hypothetical protein
MRRPILENVSVVAVLAVAFGTMAGSCGIQEHNVPPRSTGLLPSDPSSDPVAGTGGTPSATPGGQGGGDSSGGPGGSGGGGAGNPGTPAGSGGSAGAAGSGRGTGGSTANTPDAAPPPPAVPGIDLGGVRVPRDKAIVIVHFGHSNMLGHGVNPASLQPYFFTPQPRLWAYRGNGRFVAAVEPTANRSRSSEAGPGMALLRAAVSVAPDDYHFISIGLGVGSATTTDWSKGGLYYDDFVNVAKELKGKVTYGAAVIMLGITDRHLPAAQQGGFPDRVAKIVADLRADLGEPELPVLHTAYEAEATGELAPDSPVGQLFSPLIDMLPRRISNLALVPTDMTGMEDDHHFNLAGQKLFADRAIQILVDKGWARWPSK